MVERKLPHGYSCGRVGVELLAGDWNQDEKAAQFGSAAARNSPGLMLDI